MAESEHLCVQTRDPAATAVLAARLAPLLRAGDVLALDGPLGSGKTHFARALIHALGVNEDVPSPTFTLVQVYDAAGLPIWHCDLYRLGGADEAEELGLDDAFADALCLIEWPQRLADRLPANALHVSFAPGDGADCRRIRLHGDDAWRPRLQPLRQAYSLN
ncbi:MAG: tRNA (adenosine(37)-N6)-threonylcarbamoyltransferase complex ATPase subunit type 1 TsaE [Sphingomonadales bacterium]